MIAALTLFALCGSERVLVKTLADHPVIEEAWPIALDVMRSLPAPEWGNDLPRLGIEKTVVAVDASIIGYKVEADQDYHVVIADEHGHTMVIEFPDPHCARTTWAVTLFKQARKELDEVLPSAPTKAYKTVAPIPVTVVGFLFFDKVHGQTGVAPNGVEVHAVLHIRRRAQ